jgi:hypothetical protein
MEQHSAIRKHAELFDSMASAMGVDVEEAVMRGRMEFDAIADSVLRCAGCSHPDRCAGLLADGSRLAAVPDYCQNRSLLENLRPVPA